MGLSRLAFRAFLTAVLVALTSGYAVASGPSAAVAAPACSGSAPVAGSMIAEPPWAQRIHGRERLTGLADGSGITVAVIDSGVDATHPQLSGAVGAGIDVLDAGDGRIDCVGHGTAVASIIGGRPRAGTAFSGVAPGATIMPIRVSERIDGASGRAASPTALAGALRQAVNRGARVVNLSFTTDRDEPSVRDAVRYVRSRDVVVVAAVGNRQETGNPRPYPASYDGVIGVGAVQPDGTRVPTSQTGDFVDLAAPGADIIAAARGGGHARYTGTSFAAAYVAGTAVLVRQYHPHLTEAQVSERLTATADAASERDGLGAGVVNPYRAVTAQTGDNSARPAGPQTGQSDPAAPADPAGPVTNAIGPDARSRSTAYRIAGAGAVAVGLLLLGASALPRARRRRRQPG
jgi:membrane-anchored mycosin MYCP